MKFIFCIITFILVNIQAFAAAPVTHIYLAEQWMKLYPPHSEDGRIRFILGNLFPDIRYLGEIARNDTHEFGLGIDDVSSSPSYFLSGMRLHSFIDEMREELVINWHIYDHIKDIADGHAATLLKLIEDEILYDQIDVDAVQYSLATILDEEIATGASLETVQQWHDFLSLYLSARPSYVLQCLAQCNQGFLDVPPSTVKLWSKHLSDLAKKKELIDYVKRLTEQFVQVFSNP